MPLLTATGRVHVHMRRPFATTALAAAALAIAISAAPAEARKVKHLWATVNVCDTPKSPNKMGVRARMPGDGTRKRMFMRFTAQYRTGGRWKVVRGARSRWLLAGSAVYMWKEFGYTFSIDSPKPGASYVLRGLTQFQWRDKASGKVVRRTHRFTERGHPTGKDGQPRNYSAARCRVRTPARANP
jgi:hypothetical protein